MQLQNLVAINIYIFFGKNSQRLLEIISAICNQAKYQPGLPCANAETAQPALSYFNRWHFNVEFSVMHTGTEVCLMISNIQLHRQDGTMQMIVINLCLVSCQDLLTLDVVSNPLATKGHIFFGQWKIPKFEILQAI